ncbi:PKD domain-containing protein [Arcticibacter sp. MXS-1]|uniref:PKD domain-containing protein n=1 Tax=Arcticibacter sp. MXS-1 TaxID=3341726 RepID=UPI0035A91B1E
MKKLFNHIIALLLLATVWSGCKQEDPELGPAPTSDIVKFSYKPSQDNPNVIVFKNETPGAGRANWDFGNGTTGSGESSTGAFPTAGDYNVTLTVFTSGGYASSSQTVHIANTNPKMLDGPEYKALTGGPDDADGKTWVIEKDYPGHIGVGPIGDPTPSWWSAPANDKAAEGIYDDEMTFNLNNNFQYIYNNHGNTFVNGANAAGLGGVAGGDYTLNYNPPSNLTWSLSEQGGKKYITISGGGFIAYYTGVSRYEVLAISENELYLKVGDKATPANGWWLRLVPKGYSRPKEEKPLKALDLKDSFDGTGKISWVAENIDLVTNYDNPGPFDVNPSTKVAKYTRKAGNDFQYGNLQVTLDYRLDLSQRNKFKIKVLLPGYNNYSTVKPTVALKLQNSLEGGNAWASQKEVVHEVSAYNRWVELEFNFSSISDVTKYDKIVLQLGGEGHPNPGTFFIDDFELEK